MKLTLMMATTIDGMIARTQNHFPNWTGRTDKQMFKQLTQKAGVVIFGSKTYDTIGKPLPGRLNVILTRRPERYSQAKNLMLYCDTPEKLLIDLTQRGYEEAILAGGAIINTLFIKSGLVDEILLTISPKVFGQGITLFSEPLNLDLRLINIQQLETDTLMIRYRVQCGPNT